MYEKSVYSEVVYMLNKIPIRDFLKIPPTYIQFLNNNRDDTKNYTANSFSRESYCLFLKIYLKYIASNEEKNKIDEILKINNLKEENKKKDKYNIENLFKKTNYVQDINKSLIETKEKWYDVILRKIKAFFKNKN